MNAPTRQQGLETALDEALDPSLPAAEFAQRLGRLAAALTDADGAIVLDEAGDRLLEFGVGADRLAELAAAARNSDDGQAREDRRLALRIPGATPLVLAIQAPAGGRALAIAWERLLFLRKLAGLRADIASGPFEPGLLTDISALATGDWRAAQPFVDKLRRLAGANDITFGQLDGDVVEKIVIAGQPGLVAAAPARDDAKTRLQDAAMRGDVLTNGALRYAYDFGGAAPEGLTDGLQALFSLPKSRVERGWPRRLRAPAIFAIVIAAIAFIPVPDHAELPAKVVSAQQRDLIAPVSAVLNELAIEEGDLVAKGDLIASFDDGDLQLEASSERAHLAAALTKMQTARRERDAASQKDLELEVAQIEARIARIDAELAYYQVRSPISGIVVSNLAKDLVGARLPMGEDLARISSTDQLQLEAWVSEPDRVRARTGEEGAFSPDASPRDYVGVTIESISPAATVRDGYSVYRVVSGLSDSKDLREGMAGVLAVDAGRKFVGHLVVQRVSDWLARVFWF